MYGFLLSHNLDLLDFISLKCKSDTNRVGGARSDCSNTISRLIGAARMNYLRHGTHIVPLISPPSPATLQSLENQSFLECCRAKIVFLLHKHNSMLRILKIADAQHHHQGPILTSLSPTFRSQTNHES